MKNMTVEKMLKDRMHYREDIFKYLTEEGLSKIEDYYLNSSYTDRATPQCYVTHAGNGKQVVTGPFTNFIKGYLLGVNKR